MFLIRESDPCPNACHGRGVCEDYMCVCYAGFAGSECEIDLHSSLNETESQHGEGKWKLAFVSYCSQSCRRMSARMQWKRSVR